jgi:hypothetical protein
MINREFVVSFLRTKLYFALMLILKPVTENPVYHPYKAGSFGRALNAKQPGILKKLNGELTVING